jgi:hypothetical protein
MESCKIVNLLMGNNLKKKNVAVRWEIIWIAVQSNGNCTEISLIGHFMQIFSIAKNACSI